MCFKFSALQARVKELEADRAVITAHKSSSYLGLLEETARLQKLVDAAREALMNCLVERDEPDGIKFIVEEALRELDGEKIKQVCNDCANLGKLRVGCLRGGGEQ